MRREIEWLRRGAKARTTKAKGRIKEADRLIEELGDARARAATRSAEIDFTASGRRSRRLLVAEGLAKSLGGRPLVRNLDLIITPGTRIGLMGPNGSGKTTLLNVLAGALAPDAGTIERAEGLRIVRFEQQRPGLDPTLSLRRALAPEGDTVSLPGAEPARGGLGQALPVPARAARGAGRPSVGRRAGPHPHRAADAASPPIC